MSLLTCSINGVDIAIRPATGSRLAALHDGAETVVEHTTCNFGLDVRIQDIASTHGMAVAAIDELGEVRAVDRPDHPYFVATLYQPQLRSSPDAPHPVFLGLLRAAYGR